MQAQTPTSNKNGARTAKVEPKQLNLHFRWLPIEEVDEEDTNEKARKQMYAPRRDFRYDDTYTCPYSSRLWVLKGFKIT